jgi:hypothetical protein
MKISAEIRWFWPDSPPPSLEKWFLDHRIHGCVVGGRLDPPRADDYLVDSKQSELGIKQRGGGSGVEVKGLVAASIGELTHPVIQGPIELWSKWPFQLSCTESRHLFRLCKGRLLRTFDTNTTDSELRQIPLNEDEQPLDGRELPDKGCNVELTQIKLPSDAVWWTFGFEAFGGVGDVADSLCRTAGALSGLNPPQLMGARRGSYASWLSSLLIH